MKLLIPTIIKYTKIQKIINKVYVNENVRDNLSKLFGVEFNKDWVGRLWVVLNPYIQDMNEFTNSSTTIFQYNKNGELTNELAVERWIMDKMNIASEFVKNNNLFEILDYDLKKIDIDNNYLFVIKNVAWNDLVSVLKRWCWISGIGVVASIVMAIVF